MSTDAAPALETVKTSDDNYEADYDTIRDAVIAAFNPPDDDISEPQLMVNSIQAAAEFIEKITCTCDDDENDDAFAACPRCKVLGRINDEEIAR